MASLKPNRYQQTKTAIDVARAARREYDRRYRESHKAQIRDAQQRYWYRRGLELMSAQSAEGTDAE